MTTILASWGTRLFPYKHEWLLLLGFLVLGILWAWWAWGYFAQRFVSAEGRQGKLQADIRNLRRKKVAITGEGDLDPIFTGKPQYVSDLSKLKGINDDDAVELNRLGVYNYRQMATLPDEDVEVLGMHKRWKKFNFGTIRTEASGLADAEEAAMDDGDADDHATSTDRAEKSASSHAAPAAESTTTSAKSATTSGGRYGNVFSKRPTDADELQDIDGIGPSTEKSLNGIGIHKFGQIADWNDDIITGVSEDLSLGARVHDESWVPQARRLAAGGSIGKVEVKSSGTTHKAVVKVATTRKPAPKKKPVAKRVVKKAPAKKAVAKKAPAKKAAAKKVVSKTRAADDKIAKSLFKGEDVKVDDRLGIVYKRKPKVVDDLKEIKGVAKVMEGKLHKFGVYRFKQIASWKKAHLDAFGETLGSFSERMITDDWIGQAKKLAKKAK